MLGVAGSNGDGGQPSGAASVAPTAPATVHERSAGTDPTIGVPQLLLERGGRIRITALWEAYRLRFGETQYSLKDLFCESSSVCARVREGSKGGEIVAEEGW